MGYTFINYRVLELFFLFRDDFFFIPWWFLVLSLLMIKIYARIAGLSPSYRRLFTVLNMCIKIAYICTY